MATIATRPTWQDWYTKRDEVKYRRALSAYNLAARRTLAPTVEDVAAAAKLLDSVQRYALADAREWEAENSSEWYCNSDTHKDRQAMLDRRRVRLEKRLAAYGVRLVNYGLYPCIVDADGANLYMLHYYD